jgi:hypothetical protein
MLASALTRLQMFQHEERLRAVGKWPITGRTTWKQKDVPPTFTGQKKRVPVVFAVQTSHIPVYEAKLRAEYDTWLGALPASDRLVIGPTCGGSAECEPAVTPDGKARLWQPSVCEDESNLCKAAAVLDSAFQELDFDC